MRQGATTKHKMKLPISVDNALDVEVTYNQHGRNILIKHKADIEVNGQHIAVPISERESFLFDWHDKARVQVRVVTEYGEVVPSKIRTFDVEECLSQEVLSERT